MTPRRVHAAVDERQAYVVRRRHVKVTVLYTLCEVNASVAVTVTVRREDGGRFVHEALPAAECPLVENRDGPSAVHSRPRASADTNPKYW